MKLCKFEIEILCGNNCYICRYKFWFKNYGTYVSNHDVTIFYVWKKKVWQQILYMFAYIAIIKTSNLIKRSRFMDMSCGKTNNLEMVIKIEDP